MQWPSEGFDIEIPRTRILGVSLLPGVSMETFWEKSVFLINLERRSDIVQWYCIVKWGFKMLAKVNGFNVGGAADCVESSSKWEQN